MYISNRSEDIHYLIIETNFYPSFTFSIVFTKNMNLHKYLQSANHNAFLLLLVTRTIVKDQKNLI